MTLTTERQQFAEQNEMSMDFVNWFFDEKKESFGNMWFLMAAAMWEAWKGRDNREAQPVAYTEQCEISNMQATGLYLRGFPDNSQGRNIPLYTAPPATAVPDDVQRDAERWRAMLGSARIRILGSAGFDATALPGGDPDYRHFGMEIWTHYPGWLTEKNEYGIDILNKYADACRAAMLAQPVSKRYTLNSPEIPDGWKLVPLAPTNKMILAAMGVDGCSSSELKGAYQAMLAAAPEGGNG